MPMKDLSRAAPAGAAPNPAEGPRGELESRIRDLRGAIEAMAAKLASHVEAEEDPELVDALGNCPLDWPSYEIHIRELRGNLFEARRRLRTLQKELRALGQEAGDHAA